MNLSNHRNRYGHFGRLMALPAHILCRGCLDPYDAYCEVHVDFHRPTDDANQAIVTKRL